MWDFFRNRKSGLRELNQRAVRASLESTAIEDGAIDVESAVGLSDKECKLERRQKGRIRKVSFLDVDLVSDGPFWEPDS